MTRRPLLALALILALSGGVTLLALRRTSATFDEIVLVSAGARWMHTGDNSLLVDQPPLMPLLYGFAAGLTGPSFPRETGTLGYDDRWNYARAFYFDAGNDPERLALASRLVGVLCLLGLIVAVFAFVLRAMGERDLRSAFADDVAGLDAPMRSARVAALFAAVLVAFLPDAIAHAGVAYNDLPLALAYFLALWAIDAFVRSPSPKSGALAGVAVAAALGIKFSALALGPAGVLLAMCEGARRWRDRPSAELAGSGPPADEPSDGVAPFDAWFRALVIGGSMGVVAWWIVTAALYGGDPTLFGLRVGYQFTVEHALRGHPAPAYLLGHTSPTGWWWYFPVTFLLKTPVAFQLMTVVAVIGLLASVRSHASGALASPLRAPAIGVLVFAAFLLTSHLDIGFRYALPALPPLCALIGVALARYWLAGARKVRIAIAILLLMHAASTLSYHPWYLSFASEWVEPRSRLNEYLLDSSVDWGQGLLALRAWMAENDFPSVSLAYFGSALPAGYGIHYQPLPSFLPLPPDPSPAPASDGPRWTAISANNLAGLYFGGQDPFASYRSREPDAVVGRTIFLFREP